MGITIEMTETVKLPRFTLHKGETWFYNTKLESHKNDSDGIMSIGNGRIYPFQYKVIKTKESK